MFKLKAKKISLPLYFCVLTALLSPPFAHAELGGSGGKAANEAAEQRAAKEKKLEKKRLEAEAKKATEAQSGQPTETQAPAEGQQQDKPAQ